MKIKFDYQIFTTQKYGGISKYFFYLAKELNKKNNEARIISPIFISHIIRDSDFVSGKFFSIESRLILRAIRYLNMILDFLFISSKSYDVFHKTYYSVISGSKTSKNSKNIITVFDMTHEVYPNYFRDSAKVSRSKKIACKKASNIICISNSTKKDLIKFYGINDERISVIHLGFDKNIFFKDKLNNNLKSKLGKFLLYVGARNGYKNFKTLRDLYIEDSNLRSNYKLILFGGEKFSKEETSIINKHNLHDKIKRVDGSDKQLAKYYNSAEIFIYTSIYEGFGLPIIEAMACGCPVLAVNLDVTREVAHNGACLISNPFDKNELSNLIHNILTKKEFKNNLINNGFANIKRFSWDKCASETLKVYESNIKKIN